MAVKKVSIDVVVKGIEAAYRRKDGYIMGATGQDPRKWSVNSWWFTQYSGRQREKALYWREHAARVWDCNGLSEGLYKDATGVDINSKARYNYSEWCGVKGKGLIPAKYRMPGAAVFWGDTAKSIHHVAYLWKPVKESEPHGDYWLVEARGVMYGVVKTKLSERKPNFFGLMTKYFSYPEIKEDLDQRTLRNGCEGEDVKQLQEMLIRLGYDCGRWGADGDFGDATEAAVRAFQKNHGLKADGIVGQDTFDALAVALAEHDKVVVQPKSVKIVGGNCYVRTKPDTGGKIIGVAHANTILKWRGEISEKGWMAVKYADSDGWVSGKYGELI